MIRFTIGVDITFICYQHPILFITVTLLGSLKSGVKEAKTMRSVAKSIVMRVLIRVTDGLSAMKRQ